MVQPSMLTSMDEILFHYTIENIKNDRRIDTTTEP